MQQNLETLSVNVGAATLHQIMPQKSSKMKNWTGKERCRENEGGTNEPPCLIGLQRHQAKKEKVEQNHPLLPSPFLQSPFLQSRSLVAKSLILRRLNKPDVGRSWQKKQETRQRWRKGPFKMLTKRQGNCRTGQSNSTDS
jgi:hypothetical protein